MRKMVVMTPVEGHKGKRGVLSLVGTNTTGSTSHMYKVARNHQAGGGARAWAMVCVGCRRGDENGEFLACA
jgi:hypothetical protein